MELGQQIMDRFGSFSAEVKSISENFKGSLAEQSARIFELEQKMTGGFIGGGERRPSTPGAELIASDQYKSFVQNGARGMMRVQGTKSIMTANSGALVAPDHRADIVGLPRRKLTIRSLIPVVPTVSNMIQVPRQKTLTGTPAVVAEGALKPESSTDFELIEAPVRTIATWMTLSRQIMDDAPQLQAFLDVQLRHMVGQVEELTVLWGDGIGENILGLGPQATAYDPTVITGTGDNRMDIILRAIGQVERGSQLPATGIIVNSIDWAIMLGSKDTDGRYLAGGPFGDTAPRLWGVPVLDTLNMPVGQFMVANFQNACTLYDRMTTEVLISSEHADYFTRNLLAVRAEERIALVVRDKNAVVVGTFPA
jgi:HK97 family phage major capsid protein